MKSEMQILRFYLVGQTYFKLISKVLWIVEGDMLYSVPVNHMIVRLVFINSLTAKRPLSQVLILLHWLQETLIATLAKASITEEEFHSPSLETDVLIGMIWNLLVLQLV